MNVVAIRRIVFTIAFVISACYIYHPGRHAARYPFISDENVLSQLVVNNINGLNQKTAARLQLCDYETIIENNMEYSTSAIHIMPISRKLILGGEYIPQCRAKYKVAIVIPYRDRAEQLQIFLQYMHPYLQDQSLHYRVFIVEQANTEPFNRAKLFNIGATVAMKYNFTCLVLQDVDLLPLNTGNMYACTYMPRHMSSCLDTFRFLLPYTGLSGGAISITTSQFILVNGMSNMYEGWGAEDDDFYKRLQRQGLETVRFSPRLSRYTMLPHKQQPKLEQRFKLLERALDRVDYDGLNSLKARYDIKLEAEFTHILAY